MSIIKDAKAFGNKVHYEYFDSADEVVRTCQRRSRTDERFKDKTTEKYDDWEGVKDYAEALDLMKYGYQPTVDAMQGVFKATKNGEGTRFAFRNNVQGFVPIVPLALKNVPNCMVSMTMKPIKAKVLDVYYDITASAGNESNEIIKAGQALLGTIIELERQGYRFNLYAVQTYYDNHDCDMLVVKLKSASQPIDLKRISFPLTHTAFFRVIGFDWYSKVPGGKYRFGYGKAIAYDYSEEKLQEFGRQLFGKNAIYFSAAKIINSKAEHIKEVIENGNSKA